MICACIFDMDGTVANTLASIAGFGNRALEACGYPTLPVEEYRNLAGNGADILMRRMLTASGTTEAGRSRGARRKNRCIP